MKNTNLSVEQLVRHLELFNEKADRLLNSEFVDYVRKQGMSLKVTYTPHSATIDLNTPGKDATEAFVLNLRFFIQDNERSSFRNMAKTYESLSVSGDLKQEFNKTRRVLNDTLDSSSNMKIMKRGSADAFTRREIIWNIVYGLLAHSNDERRKTIEEWKKDPTLWAPVNFEFQSALLEFLRFIQIVYELNKRALAEISSGSSIKS